MSRARDVREIVDCLYLRFNEDNAVDGYGRQRWHFRNTGWHLKRHWEKKDKEGERKRENS